MKKILVLGGVGFIGSHLVDKLIKDKYRVVVVDNLSTGDKKNLNKKAKFYELDIKNPKAFRVFKKEKPDIVYYLSGPISLRRNMRDPLFEKSLNFLEVFKKVLGYSQDLKIRKFVLISSGGAVYSNAKIIPTPENYPAHPDSLYGLANLILERFLEEYSKTNNLDFIILRLSNVYGPKQWVSGVVPSFITSILKNKPPVVYGQGKKTRDFVYVGDAVDAMILSAISKKKGVLNVGSGREVSLNALVGKIAMILGKDIKPKYVLPEKKETERSALKLSKTKKELDWQPKYSLEKGLEKTINWFKKHEH